MDSSTTVPVLYLGHALWPSCFWHQGFLCENILTPMAGVPKVIQFVKPEEDISKLLSHSYQDPSRKCLSIHLIKYILVVGGGRGARTARGKGSKESLMEIVIEQPGK